ncbi:MAG: hypothetical protein E7618_02530 [Ruminococcaceae bacterium]|nr:hypothetical protein [Oscillospiraceae bacterium]
MFEKIKDYLTGIRVTRLIPCAAAAVITLITVGILYATTGTTSHLIWIIAAILYLAAVSLYIYFTGYHAVGATSVENISFLGSMTLDLIVKMPDPVMLCNSSESIIWYNAAFVSRLGNRKSISGMNFQSFAGFSLRETRSENGQGMPVTLDGYSYIVRSYTVSSKTKRFYLTVWSDCTELAQTTAKMKDDETQVAYIRADNLEELAQYTKEGTRNAANEIEKVLREWGEGAGGILTEYQSDRYLFLFRSASLAEFIDRKFDVLDRIREIRIGESSLSVTVSMGLSSVSGTLSEKERVASEALDMALQRGGDQAVVKTARGLEFFGGKTQTVQKRTKVRSRVIANELASLISKSRNVLIMGHRAADFDCIGACMGVARLATFCGVPFHIIVNSKDPNFIRCYHRIKEIPEYLGGSVFCNASEAQELLATDSLTVIVDVNNKRQFEAPAVAEISRRTVYIDHHRKTAEFDEPPLISYIEPSASSTCELVAEILEQAMPGGMLTNEEAEIMYAGILLDTKQFTRNTGVRTFGAALYLRGEGANPADAQTLFNSCLSDFISEARFESNVVIYRKCMAISCNDAANNTPADRIAAAKAADKLLTVDGVKASFALCRIEDKIHISARSSGEVNVQLILERIEGGGHFDSAATQLTGPMNEALNRLKGAIDDYLTEISETRNNP